MSDFWVTQGRASIVPFTSSIGSDVVTLWVPRPHATSDFEDKIKKVFQPFHWSVWFLCFVLICVMGVAQALCAPEGKTGKALATVFAKIKAADWSEKPSFALEGLICIAKTSGVISLQILGKDDEFSASKSELLLSIGWSFFILILTSAYTANLAAFLVHTDVGFFHRDTFEAVRSGARNCLPAVLVPRMRAAHPAADIVSISFVSNLSIAYVENHCDALAWPFGVAKRSHATVTQMCGLNLVAVDTIFELPFAWPRSSPRSGAHVLHRADASRGKHLPGSIRATVLY